MKDGLRTAFLISGGGTTMAAALDAISCGRLTGIVPACVIASKPDAGGIANAVDRGIDEANIIIVKRRDFSSAENYAEALLFFLRRKGVRLVSQNGWLPMTLRAVIGEYPGMIINQHPGPLHPGRPDFGGKGMFGRAVHAARLYFLRPR